jgi:hypothetical protein
LEWGEFGKTVRFDGARAEELSGGHTVTEISPVCSVGPSWGDSVPRVWPGQHEDKPTLCPWFVVASEQEAWCVQP